MEDGRDPEASKTEDTPSVNTNGTGDTEFDSEDRDLIDSGSSEAKDLADSDAGNSRASTNLKTDLGVLVKYIEDQTAEYSKQRAALPADRIVFRLLWWIFTPGLEVTTADKTTGMPAAYRVRKCSYHEDDRGRYVVFSLRGWRWTGLKFEKYDERRVIREFDDVRVIQDLDIAPLTPDAKAALTERGKVYASKYAGIVNADYVGSMFVQDPTTGRYCARPGSGRVMVDVGTHRQSYPYEDIYSDEINESEQQRSKKVAHLDDAHVHLLPPSIKGFHLKHKIWGEFAITRLRDIEWNNMAFKHLVISDTYRNVVQSLCDVHTGTLGAGLVKDVVPGKGEGVIMAFHGRPGTGKTLTAEAVAEHLKTPLYMVSAGELGTAALERNLQNVLRLATAWKAVLLIDEADIFLQRRSSTDLERNAVVGTFLRLLEYYNGVLIITTNRMHDMDEAFASRFSLILPFEDLSAASRRQIWEGFVKRCRPELEDAGAEFDLDELAAANVNGRVIKQTVRTAQALAVSAGGALQMEHLRQVLRLTDVQDK